MAGDYSRLEAHESEPFPDFDDITTRDGWNKNTTSNGRTSRALSSSSVSTDLELERLDPANPVDDDEEAGLSRDRKETRRQQRDRATSLSGRMSSEEAFRNGPSAEEIGTQAFMANAAVNGVLIFLW